MKALCICTSNRPEMVRQFLESLKANEVQGWTLFVSCEPDAPQVHSLINSVDFMPKVWWINGTRLGCELNTFVACFKAIDSQAQSLLYSDDDMILSPDALGLCNWYLSIPESRSENSAGLCLCTDDSNPKRPNSISPNDTWRGLVGQGYFYTREQWRTFVKPNFWCDNPNWGGHGYDWSLGFRSMELGKIILRPRLSRSQHIGVFGHHGGRIFPEHINHQKDLKYVIENE